MLDDKNIYGIDGPVYDFEYFIVDTELSIYVYRPGMITKGGFQPVHRLDKYNGTFIIKPGRRLHPCRHAV